MTRNLGPGPADRSETETAQRPSRPQSAVTSGCALRAPIGRLGDRRRDPRHRRRRRRPVPRQLHQNRSGDRDLRSRRPGDEPRREGQDARRPGRQGRLDRNRPDGTAVAAPGDGPRQMRHIPANVLVDIASTTVFGAKFVELIRPPSPRRHRCSPARCSTPSTSPSRSTPCSSSSRVAGERSTPRSSTRRSARSRRRSTAAARRSARP